MIYRTLAVLTCLVPLSIHADINTVSAFQDSIPRNSITEGVVVPVPNDELNGKWVEAYKVVAPSGAWVLEYIPKGENVENWSELIQIQYLPQASYGGRHLSASTFANAFESAIKEKFPDIKLTITPKSDDNVLIDWSLPKDIQGEKAQHELAQIISTPDGIYRVAFTKKVAQLDPELKKTWLDRLSKIQYQSSNTTPQPVHQQ
jgi:hypothetical protein